MRGSSPVQALRHAGVPCAAALVAAAMSACAIDIANLESPPDAGGGGSSGQSTSSSGGDQSGAAGPVASGGDGAVGVGGFGGGGAPGTGGAGQGGAGGSPAKDGCADGLREAYLDTSAFPDIAGCAGGFDVQGATTAPIQSCNAAGDDSGNQSGMGCASTNLCEPMWHVCAGNDEVAAKTNGAGCPSDGGSNVFWVTGQTENGDANSCDQREGNNVVGCGDLGDAPGDSNCSPLERRLRAQDCGNPATMPPWHCPDTPNESQTLTKTGPDKGGVLCCRD